MPKPKRMKAHKAASLNDHTFWQAYYAAMSAERGEGFDMLTTRPNLFEIAATVGAFGWIVVTAFGWGF